MPIPPYLSPGRLSAARVCRRDPLDVERLAGRLQRLLADLDWKELVLPLGVGWHVDHVAVHKRRVRVPRKRADVVL